MPKVRLSCTEKVYYNQTVNMSDKDYAKYLAAVERKEGDKWFSLLADKYIDHGNVSDSQELEDVEITLLKDQ